MESCQYHMNEIRARLKKINELNNDGQTVFDSNIDLYQYEGNQSNVRVYAVDRCNNSNYETIAIGTPIEVFNFISGMLFALRVFTPVTKLTA